MAGIGKIYGQVASHNDGSDSGDGKGFTKISNIGDLCKALSKYGFDSSVLDDLPQDQGVKIGNEILRCLSGQDEEDDSDTFDDDAGASNYSEPRFASEFSAVQRKKWAERTFKQYAEKFSESGALSKKELVNAAVNASPGQFMELVRRFRPRR